MTSANSRLAALVSEFVNRTAGESLLTLSEGLVKVRCMEAALALGWTLQEGAGHSPSGPVADFAAVRGGEIRWERGPRRLAIPDGSADVAIVEPFEMMLEIKTRPDYGTKSQAQFQEMDADVARAARYRQCAFLFVFDPKIYLSFSGAKEERRGRPAVAAQWFTANFPPIATIASAGHHTVLAERDGSPISLAFIALPRTYGADRIIVTGARVDCDF